MEISDIGGGVMISYTCSQHMPAGIQNGQSLFTKIYSKILDIFYNCIARCGNKENMQIAMGHVMAKLEIDTQTDYSQFTLRKPCSDETVLLG